MTRIIAKNIPIEKYLTSIERDASRSVNKSRRRYLIRKLISDIKVAFLKISGADEFKIVEMKVRHYAQELFKNGVNTEKYQNEFDNYMTGLEKKLSKEQMEHIRSIVLSTIRNIETEK